MSCRSLAVTRSLLRLGPSAVRFRLPPCRAICLGCLIVLVSSVARFLLKRFNGFDAPVSRSSSSRHLWQCCLLAALRPALRPASRPVLSCVMSSPPCLIAPRAVLGLRSSITPPCLSSGWERDGTGCFSRHRPARIAVAACLLWREWRLRLFRLRRSACSVACRRLCR